MPHLLGVNLIFRLPSKSVSLRGVGGQHAMSPSGEVLFSAYRRRGCVLYCGTGKLCLVYVVEFYFPSTVEELVSKLGDKGNNASPSCRDVSFRSTFKTYVRVGDRGRPSRTFVDGYLLPIYCLSIAYLLPILLPIYCLSYVLHTFCLFALKKRN